MICLNEKKYIIYKHINQINNKVYIGQTCQQPEKRFSNGYGYVDSPLFYRAIKKYGWNNFKTEILESNLTLEEANQKEKEYIKQYNSTNSNFGYNLSSGGGGSFGIKKSEETKEKISKTLRNKDCSVKKKIAVQCLNTKEIFISASDAIRAFNLGSVSHLLEAARGKREYYGKDPITKEKLKWKIIEKEE